ncbi:MAG: type II toxin-antitoxin system prevent-host-death family antitoxin [Firmicutes bacterium]|nr:type II toxin-antitoxin system prevent-host-death family antitoxin [Bacillota bacterium]
MSITATELKANLGKYLQLAEFEDIYITKNGKVVAKLSNPNIDRVKIAKSLIGSIPDTVSYEEAMEERLKEI